MTKKISDLIKDLGISFQELKNMTDRLGIDVKSDKSTVNEKDASRIIDTISKLKGTPVTKDAGTGKPKIKAVPLINKGGKGPVGRPVVPKNFEDRPRRKDPEQEKPAPEVPSVSEAPKEVPKEVPAEAAPIKAAVKETAPAEPKAPKVTEEGQAEAAKEAVKSTPEEQKAEQQEVPKAEEKAEAPKAAEAPVASEASEKPEKQEKAPEKPAEVLPEKKEEKKEEEYVNAPNKPMRFKKIFDSTKAPKEQPKEKAPQGDRKDRSKSAGKKDRNKPAGKDGASGRDGRSQDRKTGRNDRPQQGGDRTKSSGAAAAPVEAAKSSKGKSKKFFDRKDKDKDRDPGSKHRSFKEGDGGAKNSRYFDENSLEKQVKHRKKKLPKNNEPEFDFEEMLPEGSIAVKVPITVAGLSEQAEVSPTMIIMALMKLGIMATINQTLDKDTVEMLAVDLGLNIVVTEEEEEIEEEGLELYEDTESDLKPRAPIITVMGHVDHGKTSLLDAIRNTNVTAGESGGITQHIGASEVTINGRKIVFLDTPGHEAFTTMRARGAQVTDIAVLVVAADDGVMPQTVESISHAKAANVPIIVAINKMDKPGANPDRVKQELTEHGILVEDWGGETISVPVSAKKGEGITDLLEMILLQADMLELRANPDRLALGTVIEARLDKAKGPIATLLVTNGTLKTGQSVVAGTCSGKIRMMTNFKGDTIRKAGPATAVEILGLSEVPMAGDTFNAVKDDKIAREIAANRKEKMREDVLAKTASMTLDKLFSQIQEGSAKELNLIIKADVQGSVGAIISSLEKLETPDVKIRVIHSGVGTVTESDVMLAETSNAIIIGFNVRPTTAVANQAAASEVEIRTYRVIYNIIDDIQDAMKGMLDPEFKEQILGKAEIRDTFKVPNVGTVGGAYVTEGKLQRNAQIRLVRDGIVIHEGTISSLQRFKDAVKEVNTGYECGIGIENYNDIKPEDIIECFIMVEIER